MTRKEDLQQFFISANTMQDYKPNFDLEKFTDEYIDRNPLDLRVMPKIAEVRQMALQELELQDTKDDIANEEVSRKDLWRSAFQCGAIALMAKLESNFSA